MLAMIIHDKIIPIECSTELGILWIYRIGKYRTYFEYYAL